MPQKSGFFDTTVDDPREYPAREFAEYFSRFIGNGVFAGGTKLKVTATGKDAKVSIDLGYGWINGYMYSVYDTPVVLPIQPATTQDRIDRVVLRLDVSTPVRSIRAVVLQGNPASSPNPPALVRSGDIYDLSLAQVLVKANTTTIQPHQITDERLNTQLCGVVTALIDQADTTSIFNEFQSWLKTKTTEYQKQWSDFLQGVQTSGFATPEYVRTTIDEKMGQKHALSASNGTAIYLVGVDLNDIDKTGFYTVYNPKNAPVSAGTIPYVEVISHSSNSILQKLYNGGINKAYMRGKIDGTWQPWAAYVMATDFEAYVTATDFAAYVKKVVADFAAVKQSGVEAKRIIVDALNAKGISASMSDSWATLASKLRAIQTAEKGVL